MSLIPNRSLRTESVEPMMTMETPNRKIPVKTEIKAIFLFFMLFQLGKNGFKGKYFYPMNLTNKMVNLH